MCEKLASSQTQKIAGSKRTTVESAQNESHSSSKSRTQGSANMGGRETTEKPVTMAVPSTKEEARKKATTKSEVTAPDWAGVSGIPKTVKQGSIANPVRQQGEGCDESDARSKNKNRPSGRQKSAGLTHTQDSDEVQDAREGPAETGPTH